MIVHPKIEDYLTQLLPEQDILLAEMEAFGRNVNFPIIGPVAGNILFQYAKLLRAKRILELGSGFGYSAFWFARGIPEDGNIICTDFSVKNKEKAETYFKRAGLLEKIDFRIGDAFDILQKSEGEFDIILNDIQKTNYPEIFVPALEKLRRGGLLISDNVLWHGKVAEKGGDENTRAIQKFNEMIFESNDVITSILPVRDGLAVCLKK